MQSLCNLYRRCEPVRWRRALSPIQSDLATVQVVFPSRWFLGLCKRSISPTSAINSKRREAHRPHASLRRDLPEALHGLHDEPDVLACQERADAVRPVRLADVVQELYRRAAGERVCERELWASSRLDACL